jgi:hypothetical protein
MRVRGARESSTSGLISKTAILLVCVLIASLPIACSRKAVAQKKPTPANEVLGELVKPAVPPGHLSMATPKQAVVSYLKAISFAYRHANSAIALPTMTSTESVRVDSYVELNREEGRVLEQQLVDFQVKSLRTTKTAATLVAAETWRYRYIDVKSRRYKGPEHTARYETTYKLERSKAGWLVAAVDAKALTPIE